MMFLLTSQKRCHWQSYKKNNIPRYYLKRSHDCLIYFLSFAPWFYL